MQGQNLAARAGRWSALHARRATLAWILFVVVAVAAGRVAGTLKLSDAEQATGEAARAQRILGSAGFSQPAAEAVLVQSAAQTATDPAFRATIQRVVDRLHGLANVQDVRSPLAPDAKGQISADGHAALVQFDVSGKQENADKKVQPILAAVDRLQRQSRGFTVAEFGFASATKELNDTIGKDFKRAEIYTVAITFLVLIVGFGALMAAGIPVLLAFSAVLASIGLSELISHLSHASDATQSVILLMGMAVGVDYSLFYVRREREERHAGWGSESLPRAAATSGQAVLISGGTVLIAMAGMLLSGSKIFTSIGMGAMIVVFTTLVGSLTVLPALLHKLGNRIEWGSLPFKRRDSESRVWNAILRPVLRFPLAAALITAALLVVIALPTLHIHTKLLSFTDLPRDIPIVRTYTKIQKAFPGAQTPAQVVIRAADVRSAPVQSAVRALEQKALATGQMFRPFQTFVNPAGTVERLEVPLQGNGDNAASVAALKTLRGSVLPRTIGTIAGVDYAVTGETAGTYDFNQTMKTRFPIVFVFVLGFAFLLLLLTFRSVVVPLTAIVLNLLSVAAAYGVLVWIFQDGHLQGVLNFHSNGGVVTWLPLFLFTVLFGLSMDYHVYLLSRIKEHVDRGESNEQAVANGIRTTASTITAAAAVMIAVFGVFASLRTLDIKQLGVGLAVAVLIDATVIRGVLVPATMKLLGEWNWYLPRWLEWLPRLAPEPKLDEEPAPRKAPAPALE